MAYVHLLRRLVDFQQFEELKGAAEDYYVESGDIRALPLAALASVHLGDYQGGMHYMEQIDTHAVNFDIDTQVDLAALYVVTMRMEEAQDLLQSVLKQQPEHALALARLGICKSWQEHLDEARALFEHSAHLHPGRVALYGNLVQLCLKQNDIDAAQQWLDRAIARFEEIHHELPEQASRLQIQSLRALQFEIWMATESFTRLETWFEEKRDQLDEMEWCALLVGCATMLSGHDDHEQAFAMLREGANHYPNNLLLHEQLAQLAQLQGYIMQAVQLLRKCIRLAKQQEKPEVALWCTLSDVYLHRDDDQAFQAAEMALKLADLMEITEEHSEERIKNLRMQAKYALAQVESQKQNYDKAESIFQEILDENPWFLPALQALGQQQMQRGNIDAAVKLFERVKEIAPAKGYSALINARQFPEDEETLHKIEKVARQPSMSGSASGGLLFQLASAWEKRKEYNKAFSLAQDANALNKRLLKYDAKQHRNRCARIRAAFPKAFFDHRKDCGVMSTLPVFVVGMPRSGTTLVEQILASHSEIFGAGELGVIPQVIQGLERWERHIGSGRHYPDCVDDLNPFVTEGIANGVLKELREIDEDAKFIVDKLPHNFENIGLIKFLFPHAKIISVRRDPRDIAISNYFTDYQAKHGGMGFAYDLTAIGEQLGDHNLLMHHWKQIFPGEILEINYEDVVENTEGLAKKMLEYIGVAWEPEVLAFNELDRPVKTASVWQVRQPIYKTSKAKWMRYEWYLGPLTAGTNGKIVPDPITDMERFPVPGMFVDGVADYEADRLDAAEMNFKKVLHHFPEHAAANFMLGLVYVRKGYFFEAMPLMEKAIERCPWNKNWRNDFKQVCDLAELPERFEQLKARMREKNREKFSHANDDLEEVEHVDNEIDFMTTHEINL
ncbi:MAG: sulfotransferase [Zetaproteobacteria bacterium]|nr:sulfotransferase [Zetaproteobacteria bacterium]